MTTPIYPKAIMTGRTTRTAAGTPVLGFINEGGPSAELSYVYLQRLELTVVTAAAAPSELWVVPANNFGNTGTPSVYGRNQFGDIPTIEVPEGVTSVGRPTTILDWSVLPTLAALNIRPIYSQFLIPSVIGNRIVLDFEGGIAISRSVNTVDANPLLLWNFGAGACATFDFNAYFA